MKARKVNRKKSRILNSLISTVLYTNPGSGSSTVCSNSKGDKPLGCPKKLASLVRAGDYDLSKAHSITTAAVKSVCEAADIPFQANSSKV